MENNEWTWQLSLKLGQDRSALLNVRAKDIAEFAEALRNLASNAPEIAAAAAMFEPKRAEKPFDSIPVETARRGEDEWPANVPTPQPPATKPTGHLGTEIGPFVLKAESKAFIAKSGKNAGKASSRYVASLPGGITASTFDELTGSILLQLNGQNAYARVNKNDKGYYDLVSVRPA